jgi:hypothetical protein
MLLARPHPKWGRWRHGPSLSTSRSALQITACGVLAVPLCIGSAL